MSAIPWLRMSSLRHACRKLVMDLEWFPIDFVCFVTRFKWTGIQVTLIRAYKHYLALFIYTFVVTYTHTTHTTCVLRKVYMYKMLTNVIVLLLTCSHTCYSYCLLCKYTHFHLTTLSYAYLINWCSYELRCITLKLVEVWLVAIFMLMVSLQGVSA